MKLLILGLVFSIFTTVHAQEDNCLSRIGLELKTDSEMYLFKKHEKVQEFFELKCEETIFGNTVHSSDAFVFVHEAAHFEDLGWDAGDFKPVDPTNPAKDFNLYTANNEHIGDFESFKHLPSVKHLIRPYLEKEKPTFLEEGSIYMDMHDGYIGAEDSMAADIIQGMATELNGYTHGAAVQFRVMKKLPNPVVVSDGNGGEYSMENPYASLPTQTNGIMYFLYNFNLYLNILKNDHPKAWEKFFTSHNRDYLKRLLEPSVEVLKSLNHCDLMESYEPMRFYVTEIRNENLANLVEILGKEMVGSLICSDEKGKWLN